MLCSVADLVNLQGSMQFQYPLIISLYQQPRNAGFISVDTIHVVSIFKFISSFIGNFFSIFGLVCLYGLIIYGAFKAETKGYT